MAQKGRQGVAQAFSEFAAKLKRYSQQEGEVSPAPTQTAPSPVLQQTIDEREAAFRASVLGAYARYKNPSKDIALDMQNLLKAYNLFKAVQEAGNPTGDGGELDGTHLSYAEYTSPLCRNSNYTKGASFIYLIASFMYEQNVSDYVPVFVKSLKTPSYDVLSFIPAQEAEFSMEQRQVLSIIKEEFYTQPE